MKLSITHDRLLKLLDYNEFTGEFYRKRGAGGIKAGTRADRPKHDGYQRVVIDNDRYSAHRLAWFYYYGYWPSRVDHIDGNPANNAIVNLREVTQSENCRNRVIRRDNKWGVTGVSKTDGSPYWVAAVSKPCGTTESKTTKDFFEAVAWRKSKEIEYGYSPRHGRYNYNQGSAEESCQ